MAEDVASAVLEAAEELYAGPLDDFVPRRAASGKAVAAEHGKPLGQQVGRLRKPSVAAWTVNLLVRRESEQIDQVLRLGEQLRAAAESLDGEELRALTRQRRQLTGALTTTARRLAKDAGHRLSEPVADQVEGVLTAALLDPVAAEVVRTGRLVTAFTSTGMSDLDVDSVVALPEALDHHAVASGPPEPQEAPARPGLRLVEDPGAALRVAEQELEEAREHASLAEQEREDVRREVQDLDARRLELQARAEEVRRELAALDQEADEVDEQHEEALATLEEAGAVLEEARAEEQRARAEVTRLQG